MPDLIITDENGKVLNNTSREEHKKYPNYLIRDRKIASDVKHFIKRIAKKHKAEEENVIRVIKNVIKK